MRSFLPALRGATVQASSSIVFGFVRLSARGSCGPTHSRVRTTASRLEADSRHAQLGRAHLIGEALSVVVASAFLGMLAERASCVTVMILDGHGRAVAEYADASCLSTQQTAQQTADLFVNRAPPQWDAWSPLACRSGSSTGSQHIPTAVRATYSVKMLKSEKFGADSLRPTGAFLRMGLSVILQTMRSLIAMVASGDATRKSPSH